MPGDYNKSRVLYGPASACSQSAGTLHIEQVVLILLVICIVFDGSQKIWQEVNCKLKWYSNILLSYMAMYYILCHV